ncbi:MAG: phosphoribosylanthranilate isomerase [Pseudomonadota bacterium]
MATAPSPAAGHVRVKICGLKTPGAVDAAVSAGAAYVGFVFFRASPRSVASSDAGLLADRVPAGIVKVGLVVDAEDATLDAILDAVPLDMLQLHGAESPARVAAVRGRYGLPVMKAIGLRDEGDLASVDAYARVADQLLIDAKPPKDAVLPGGNGLTFDWRLLQGREFPMPWMLAGGLNAENAAEAVAATGARQLDVSSGVEAAPGVKDAAKIAAFLAAVAAP